jgi:hypothetical protein
VLSPFSSRGIFDEVFAPRQLCVTASLPHVSPPHNVYGNASCRKPKITVWHTLLACATSYNSYFSVETFRSSGLNCAFLEATNVESASLVAHHTEYRTAIS